MSFCTAINCLDGRIQSTVILDLTDRFDVLYVDLITDAAPMQHLTQSIASEGAADIVRRVDISIRVHDTKHLAILAHERLPRQPSTRKHPAPPTPPSAGRSPASLSQDEGIRALD